MRIAQLVSMHESVPPKGNHSGLEIIVSDLTEELVRRGHQVTLFAPADSKTKAKLVSIYPHSSTKYNYGERQINVQMACIEENLRKCLSEAENFDLIHSHIGNIAAKFSCFIKKPILHTIHSPIDPLMFPNKKYFKYKKIFLKSFEHRNNFFVCISKFQKKGCLYPREKTFVIYNGIKIQDFEFNEKSENYLAFLGAITFNKGSHLAIEVAKKLKIKLKLAGNLDEEYYKKYIKPELKKELIEYVGPVDKKQRSDFLKNAKALLVPIQWDEPFGLVMPEAMACGTPVIGFRRGSIPEIIKNGKTGFVVDNVDQMIEAVKKINQINRLDCRKHVEKNFTVEKMVDEYERVYQKVIKMHIRNK